MDESTPTKKDPLEQAEEQLARTERSVADATRRVVEHERCMSETLSEARRKTTDVDLAVSDYLSAAVASGIAAEMYKRRTFDCETARHALEHANKRRAEVSEQRDDLKSRHSELRDSYTSSQEDARRVKSRLMNQEMDWIVARADYYSARLQMRMAADHFDACEEALSRANERLKAAKSESDSARSRLDDIESSMDELLEKANLASRKLESSHDGLIDIMSQRQHSEVTYLSVEQSVSHAQQDMEWLNSEQTELQEQLTTAKQLEEDASKKVEQLREEIQELGRRSVNEFEEEQRVRRMLRRAEKKASVASREHNQEYLKRALETNREQLGHRDQESANRTTRALAMMAGLAIIACAIAYAAQWQAPVVFSVAVALSCALLGSIATSIGISPRSWSRWLQRTGQWRKNWRSRLSNSRSARGTRSK